MRNRGLRTGLTLLLSGAVLLAGVTPPTVPHAHAGGDRVHDHRQPSADVTSEHHDHPHAHGHPQPHPHPHDSCENCRVGQAAFLHSHLVLLGFEFYIPRGEHQDSPDGPSDHDRKPVVLIRLLDSEVTLASCAAGEWLFVSIPSWRIVSPDVEAHPALGSRRQTLLTSHPLCDSARGERSGVQLI